MPIIETKGAASSQGFGQFAQAKVPANYIEDVFSTYLYTGNGTSQTITNNIDLSTKGGLVWLKSRSSPNWRNCFFDTQRGVLNRLASNNTDAQELIYYSLTSFNSNGFSLEGAYNENEPSGRYASWTFAKQKKFFDIQTYTGNGLQNSKTIPHNLGSVPAVVIIKAFNAPNPEDAVQQWVMYHRSLPSLNFLRLNTTAATQESGQMFRQPPDATNIYVGDANQVNISGVQYIAYIFAHNAGGFGSTGTDNVISCGSYVGTGTSTPPQINLGYEPQWILIKNTTTAGTPWELFDTMRGIAVSGNNPVLLPNTTGAEINNEPRMHVNATGFYPDNTTSAFENENGSTYIYMAIRRGPMKVPTSGTSVFSPISITPSSGTVSTTNFPVDFMITTEKTTGGTSRIVHDKLRGVGTVGAGNARALITNDTTAEFAGSSVTYNWWNTGFTWGAGFAGEPMVAWNFKRAPSFFDEVCYAGTGANGQVINHNLSAIPEMVIIKGRDSNSDWFVYQAGLSSGNSIYLNRNYAQSNDGGPAFSLSTTALTISRTYVSNLNSSGVNYVAYLFATCAGVSKVGSYTGNGSTQTINCGFTGGARFVLIKRTDSTGGWYVYDSARGMTVLTDPYLFLNNTDAETATLGSVTTVSTGFALNSAILAAINVSGGTYIFLAIA